MSAQVGDHDHPTLVDVRKAGAGNGLLLFFRVDDFDAALVRARSLVDTLAKEPEINPATGTNEFAVWDLDSYYVMISSLS